MIQDDILKKFKNCQNAVFIYKNLKFLGDVCMHGSECTGNVWSSFIGMTIAN